MYFWPLNFVLRHASHAEDWNHNLYRLFESQFVVYENGCIFATLLIQSPIDKGLEVKSQFCNVKTIEIWILLSQNFSKSESDQLWGLKWIFRQNVVNIPFDGLIHKVNLTTIITTNGNCKLNSQKRNSYNCYRISPQDPYQCLPNRVLGGRSSAIQTYYRKPSLILVYL